MNVYQVLGHAIAESVHSVGTALRGLAATPVTPTSARQGSDNWVDQFSPASLHQRTARRQVDALYRAATVRL